MASTDLAHAAAESAAEPVAPPPSPPSGGAQTPALRFATRRGGPRWWWAVLLLPFLAVAGYYAYMRAFPPKPYSVSVAVTLKPYDAQIWSMVNADSFAAAQALDPALPDPTAIPTLAQAAITPESTIAPLDPVQVRMEAYVGPPATRYIFRGATATDTARAHYCLTVALYYEAASESDDGMRGVAQVVLNRTRHPSFPGSVCGVVFQGSQRAGVCQFTFSCDGSMARVPNRGVWARASRIAAEALAGRTFPPVGLATHYHTQAVWPSWGKTLAMTNIVGAHIFHRWRGRYGTPAAFSRPYSGHEPVPGPYLPIAAQLAARNGRAMGTAAMPGAGVAGAGVAGVGGAGTVGGVGIPTTPAGAPDAATMAAIAAARNAGAPACTAGAAPPMADMPTGTAQPGFSSAPIAPTPQAQRRPSDITDPRLAGSGSIREEYRNSGSAISR
ncbi:MAG: cell wall hydrolase [Sphingopyxis sp.]